MPGLKSGRGLRRQAHVQQNSTTSSAAARRTKRTRRAICTCSNTDVCASRCAQEYGNLVPRTSVRRRCYEMIPGGRPARTKIEQDGFADSGKRLQAINFANCVHCKTCDIMDPYRDHRLGSCPNGWRIPAIHVGGKHRAHSLQLDRRLCHPHIRRYWAAPVPMGCHSDTSIQAFSSYVPASTSDWFAGPWPCLLKVRICEKLFRFWIGKIRRLRLCTVWKSGIDRIVTASVTSSLPPRSNAIPSGEKQRGGAALANWSAGHALLDAGTIHKKRRDDC